MTQEKEVLRMALEFIERVNKDGWILADFEDQMYEVITAIKEALARPEYQSTADKSKLEKVPAKGTLLAQSEHEFVRGECVKCGASIERQEPVAWMDDYNACKCPDNEARCFSDKVFRMMQKHTDSLVKRQEPVAKVCHDLDGHIGWNPNLKQLPNEGTPLYTTPPQRKPLTDEHIGVIAIKSQDGISPHDDTLRFARAIEAAHGIKE